MRRNLKEALDPMYAELKEENSGLYEDTTEEVKPDEVIIPNHMSQPSDPDTLA